MTKDFIKDVYASGQESQYDDRVKLLLSHKEILAYILTHTLDEYKGMDVKDVMSLIEPETYAGTVPVDTGLTNKSFIDERGKKIVGLNTENAGINEGLARFDVVFKVLTRDRRNHIIVNIEAQKDNPSDYPIFNRAVFYVGRLITAQKEREFMDSHYGDIKNVVSIWILMNMNKNSLSNFAITQRNHVIIDEKIRYNKEIANIDFIGIDQDIPERKKGNELHRLLSVLLSPKLDFKTKVEMMKNEYPEVFSDDVREEMNTMCNLGEGLAERSEAIGVEKSLTSVILAMYKIDEPLEKIAFVTGKSEDEIKEIIKKYTQA